MQMHVGCHVADINSTISSCIQISNNEMKECYIEQLKLISFYNEIEKLSTNIKNLANYYIIDISIHVYSRSKYT